MDNNIVDNLKDVDGQHQSFYKTYGMKIKSGTETDNISDSISDSTVSIYLCVTMWHENKAEMIQMLKSVMRMDKDQCAKKKAPQRLNVNSLQTQYYQIETHIFFDDAFEQKRINEKDERIVNKFVKRMVKVMDEAASDVYKLNIKINSPKRIPTPYGGRLEWILPEQNKLIAHLKDKTKIRHGKRWSQVMCMYYLLEQRITALPINKESKKTIADNTFILTLDGDINFKPSAVHLLVDLMKKNKKLGAACGRIHPAGSGLIVWYQIFEYAISHWLLKATEHMIGCVLCSPGCFSLLRASALMDNNVMHRYTTKPTEAFHYIQYDQGEDRWLSTLLLQRGFRIEYCADSYAYTHCPEEFSEFFAQRRRWISSTIANLTDLLRDYKRIVRVNENISTLYILYQAIMMLATILGPAIVFIVLLSATNNVLALDSITSFYLNATPVVIFIIICFCAKNEWQIFAAQELSTVYAILMLTVIVSIGTDFSVHGIWIPSGIFFMVTLIVFITATIIYFREFLCIFPSVIYILGIPCMHLLLTLYSIINLHVVSWGTREKKTKLKTNKLTKQQNRIQSQEAIINNNNKKGLFSRIPLNDYFNRKLSYGLSCVCCSASKHTEERVHNDFKDTENLTEINKLIDSKSQSTLINEQISHQNSAQSDYTLEIREINKINSISDSTSFGDQNEKDSFEAEKSNQQSEEDKIQQNATKSCYEEPNWIKDKGLKNGSIDQLSADENKFWDDFIRNYLQPLNEDRKHQQKIASDLIKLRNRVVVGVCFMNALFLICAFLLQMISDVFSKKWHIKLESLYFEPIGLILIFFGAILLLQFICMLFHRFGTFKSLLAFVLIYFCSSKKADLTHKQMVDKNAV